MTKPIKDPAVYHARTMLGLREIYHPDHGLAVYQRPSINPALQRFLDWLPDDVSPGFSIQTTAQTVHHDIMHQIGNWSTYHEPTNPIWQGFAEDLARLTKLYTALTQAHKLILYVKKSQWTESFHIDAVNLVLSCTYRGKGMEFLSPGGKYAPLTLRSDHLPKRLSPYDYKPKNIQSVAPMDLALFKGYRYAHEQCRALYHSSPLPTEPEEHKNRFTALIFSDNHDAHKPVMNRYHKHRLGLS